MKDPESKEKGYVFKFFLIDSGETTLKVTTYNNIYKGDTEEDSVTIKYNGSKNISWSLDRGGIVQVTQGTEKNKLTVTGLDFGTATLTVRAGSLTAECKLYCYYDWKQDWETTAKKASTIYKGPGSECGEKAKMAKDAKFIVKGDDGGSAGWAYGYTTKNKTNYWGYVRIENISTKGTVSQYNNLPISSDDNDKNKKWVWPVVTPSGKTAANYIQSPYGKRNTNPTMHKGFDITTGISEGIKGYEVISAFSGKVIYISTNPDNSTGYCVGIRSDITDPVSGEKMVAFYMHLKNSPSVRLWQEVSAEELLGYVGTTGNSSGYHLHFEVNNKNASIEDGSTARQYYAYLINPLYFYMDKTVRINYGCDAETTYYGSYWYGND